MKKSYLIIGVLVIIAVFTTGCNGNAEVETGTEVGMRAPDFTLPGLQQDDVKLSDFRGKKVFLNFWATWCPPCQEEMPDIQQLYENNQKNVAIVAVNIGESKAKAASYMMENQLDFRVLIDQNRKIAQEYMVRGIPTSYFLNEDGVIIEKHTGALSYDQMVNKLELEN